MLQDSLQTNKEVIRIGTRGDPTYRSLSLRQSIDANTGSSSIIHATTPKVSSRSTTIMSTPSSVFKQLKVAEDNQSQIQDDGAISEHHVALNDAVVGMNQRRGSLVPENERVVPVVVDRTFGVTGHATDRYVEGKGINAVVSLVFTHAARSSPFSKYLMDRVMERFLGNGAKFLKWKEDFLKREKGGFNGDDKLDPPCFETLQDLILRVRPIVVLEDLPAEKDDHVWGRVGKNGASFEIAISKKVANALNEAWDEDKLAIDNIEGFCDKDLLLFSIMVIITFHELTHCYAKYLFQTQNSPHFNGLSDSGWQLEDLMWGCRTMVTWENREAFESFQRYRNISYLVGVHGVEYCERFTQRIDIRVLQNAMNTLRFDGIAGSLIVDFKDLDVEIPPEAISLRGETQQTFAGPDQIPYGRGIFQLSGGGIAASVAGDKPNPVGLALSTYSRR
ncbi:hypothetical protein D9757_010467 [Collybiopsis confluens]|uniref:Uncharacterized protein n=1 Tax=Collybiopsis confluens TaxID=2823264 RepID=A0A8H5GRD8_9AGAR|nr:hypothetical protein D9757_010467 [Collybiopsis confluens]